MAQDSSRKRFTVVESNKDTNNEGPESDPISGHQAREIEWDNAVGGRERGVDDIYLYALKHEALSPNPFSARLPESIAKIIQTIISSGRFPWNTPSDLLRNAIINLLIDLDSSRYGLPADVVKIMALLRSQELTERAENLDRLARETIDGIERALSGPLRNSPHGRRRYLLGQLDEVALWPDEYQERLANIFKREGIDPNVVTDRPDPREGQFLPEVPKHDRGFMTREEPLSPPEPIE